IVIALILFATVFWGWMGLVAVLTFILSTLYLRYKFMQRLGGITGDTVGASIEITESMMLLAIAILWFLIN
ncbi:adenosylcobinamide-GDP ribazoletransferase, partial [Acinetobacter towneri]